MPDDFSARLRQAQDERSSLLCVGLDPDPQRVPSHLIEGRTLPEAVLRFNHELIEATGAFACAFKLNFAFYEALGAEGWRVLEETVRAAARKHLVVADAKRSDIGNSARFYATAIFEQLGCDACTVAPYMGSDSVQPFLTYPGRAAFVLVRTSNAGAAGVQELVVSERTLFLEIADQVVLWARGRSGEVGFVVGATDVVPVSQIRKAHPDVPLLVPGVGAQGGDAKALLAALGGPGGPAMINSSRQIIYASEGPDFAEAAGREAERIRVLLQDARKVRQ